MKTKKFKLIKKYILFALLAISLFGFYIINTRFDFETYKFYSIIESSKDNNNVILYYDAHNTEVTFKSLNGEVFKSANGDFFITMVLNEQQEGQQNEELLVPQNLEKVYLPHNIDYRLRLGNHLILILNKEKGNIDLTHTIKFNQQKPVINGDQVTLLVPLCPKEISFSFKTDKTSN
ncbi:MAG: hypothetical protein J5773_03275 [Verrucomicrobia bacterium]|nr:hypothetical protein [Verrucomicrobiota bacterium]